MTSEKTPAAADREQILEEHRKIAELTAGIVKSRNLREMASRLKHLEPLLERHFRREEEQEGLHGSIRALAPQHVAALKQLAVEHRSLLQQVVELRRQVGECLDGPVRLIRKSCKELFEGLQAHEARENDLFLDTVWTDLGTGD